jgi:hypothetical protein
MFLKYNVGKVKNNPKLLGTKQPTCPIVFRHNDYFWGM